MSTVVKLDVTGPGGRTQITVERGEEIAAIGEAIGMLLATRGSKLREAINTVRLVAELLEAPEPERES